MCDYCADFFHFKCVGLSEAEANAMDQYKCQQCMNNPNSELIYEEGKLSLKLSNFSLKIRTCPKYKYVPYKRLFRLDRTTTTGIIMSIRIHMH